MMCFISFDESLESEFSEVHPIKSKLYSFEQSSPFRSVISKKVGGSWEEYS
jgi:hypothetical protein